MAPLAARPVALLVGGALSLAAAVPPARGPVDYQQEIADIRTCAESDAFPQQVALVAGEGGGRATVSRSVACFMKIVQDMVDEGEEAAPDAVIDIPLPKVDSESLSIIVDFATNKVRQAGDQLQDLKFSVVPRPLPGPLHETDGVLSEDAAFMDQVAEDLNRLFRLTNAANFVDCPSLLELCAARIAQMFIGRAPQEIREAIPRSLLDPRADGG
mmetsp:Transcript_24790/g.69502  ORF Transcript_24790/g.69502 Transcript_24790/m.69502 type:complete len:214 (-) Transcript_24790:144-785(-)